MATTYIFSGIRLGILITIGACNQLNGQPPTPESEAGHKIDLSNWYLTLPIDSGNNSKVDFIEQFALDNSPHMDQVKPRLDKPLVFYCPFTGLSTPNSKYSRSALREQMEPVPHDSTVRIRAIRMPTPRQAIIA